MKFVGRYTDQIRNAMIASSVSGLNLIYVSKPGWGKTEMSIAGANAICNGHKKDFGEFGEGVIFIEVDLSSPSDIVKGSYDPLKALDGNLVRMIKNTPYDPDARIIIVDEIWRGSDAVFDALIHATSNKHIAPSKRPVFWGTANFVGDAERTEALRDRFGLWVYLSGDLNPKEISKSYMESFDKNIDDDFAKKFPSWDECLEIRALRPGKNAIEVVSDMVDTLTVEAEKANFTVNPRRNVQWTELLLRAGFLYHARNNNVPFKDVVDFKEVPIEASDLLKHAYPCTTPELARSWSKVTITVGDPIGEAIELVKANAVTEFRKIASSTSVSDKNDKISTLGVTLANAQSNLQKVGKDDPRVKSTSDFLTEIFQRAIAGKPLE